MSINMTTITIISKALGGWYNPSYHYHQGVLTAWIPLSLSRHPSLLAIALGKFSWQHPVSAQRWGIFVFAGQSTLMFLLVGVYKTLMSTALLFHQYQACLARLILRWEISDQIKLLEFLQNREAASWCSFHVVFFSLCFVK